MRSLVQFVGGLLLLLTFTASALTSPAQAGTLSGTVRNAETKEPLVAANVFLDNTPYGVATDADGQFALSGIPSGRYTLTASFIGYGVYKKRVEVSDAPLTLVITLHPEVLPGQTVVVTASRAKDRETPVAFSNLTKEDIRKSYYAQDVPVLLETMPSVNAYSDAGNGIGYSYMSIRGFDQKRINVLINGIPHNGPTSHEVYWIDLPDFLSNVEDIQVQRGVGSSLYGSSALGGTVNVVTSNFSTRRTISAYAGMGSFDTRKYSFAFNSGLVDNSYVMCGRFSRIRSDGYRDQSWTSLWSYFLGVARYDATMTTKFQVYGGPEQTHLAYYGVSRDYIEGKITGDVRRDRRFNPLEYENELDNFNQPHYELHHDWQITEDLRLNNTLYTIKGKGSYDQFRKERSLEEYRLPTFVVKDSTLYPASWYEQDAQDQPEADANGEYTVVNSDLIKSRWVEDDEYGWLPRLTWEHGRGTLITGGELRRHRGQHWGMITWLGASPPSINPDYVYYSYAEKKLTVSAFAHEVFRLTPKITLMGDVQAVQHTYSLSRDTVTHYSYTTDFRWMSPKAGINFNLTDRIHLFGNVSMTKREPVTSDLVDPQDYWSEPNFAGRDTVRAGGRITEIRLSRPTVGPERMINYELGAGYRSPHLSATANLYHMDFRNEIVPYAGQISEASGLPVTGNAERSVHQGVELEASVKPLSFVEVSGNLSVNDDHFVRYTENVMDWDAWTPVSVVRDGKRIAGFPAMLANVRGIVSHWGWTAGLTWRYVGRQYLDNSETQDNSVAPYHVTDLMLAYRFGSRFGLRGLEVRLQVNNVFDQLYEAAGYMDDVYAVASEGEIYGTPYFIPAATRNAFLSIQWEW